MTVDRFTSCLAGVVLGLLLKSLPPWTAETEILRYLGAGIATGMAVSAALLLAAWWWE